MWKLSKNQEMATIGRRSSRFAFPEDGPENLELFEELPTYCRPSLDHAVLGRGDAGVHLVGLLVHVFRQWLGAADFDVVLCHFRPRGEPFGVGLAPRFGNFSHV